LSAGEASRDAAFTKAQRCPYCHESIAVDEDAWVACEQCLGRHHRSCWDESGSCSSCGHTQGLPNQQSITAPLDLAPLTEEVSSPSQDLGPATAPAATETDHRRETARLFDEDQERARLLASLPLTPLSMGLWPVIQGERRLHEHRQANQRLLDEEPITEDLAADLREQLHMARQRAGPTAGGVGSLLRRYLAPLASVVGWVSLFGCLLTWLVAQQGGGWNYTDMSLLSMWTMVASALAAFGQLGYVHAFREAVINHERDQLFVKLIARAVPPAASKDLLERLSRNWTVERIGQGLISLLAPIVVLVALSKGGAIPLVACLIPVAVATLLTPAVFSSLQQHAKHEQEADEVAGLYGQGEGAKGGDD
jgi:hypothetical protein